MVGLLKFATSSERPSLIQSGIPKKKGTSLLFWGLQVTLLTQARFSFETGYSELMWLEVHTRLCFLGCYLSQSPPILASSFVKGSILLIKHPFVDLTLFLSLFQLVN